MIKIDQYFPFLNLVVPVQGTTGNDFFSIVSGECPLGKAGTDILFVFWVYIAGFPYVDDHCHSSTRNILCIALCFANTGITVAAGR